MHAVSVSFLNYSCDSDLRVFESEFLTPNFCSAAKGNRTGASDALDSFGHDPKLPLSETRLSMHCDAMELYIL